MEGESSGEGKQKLGGSKILHSQTREVVLNVFNFMTKEAKEGPILLKQIQKRVSQAIGISLSSVQRILKEVKNNHEKGFSTPRKKRVLKKQNFH